MRQTEDVEEMGKGPRPIPLEAAVAPPDADAFHVVNLARPGSIVMLAGPPGSAKSFAVRQLGYSCAAGLPDFLDNYGIDHKLAVGIVDEDNGDREEWRREVALLEHLGIDRIDLEGSFRISHAGVLLDQPHWQRWLRALIAEYQLDMLILDPISEMHPGKELRDDPGFFAMRRFLKELRRDFSELVIVLVHHTRKPSTADRNSPRNLEDVRGQWGQTPDVVILLTPLGERRLRWEVHKRVPYSALILEQADSGALVKVADETTAPRRKASTDDRVLAAIEAGADSSEQIEIATGIPHRTVYNALQRLRVASLVAKGTPIRLLGEPGSP